MITALKGLHIAALIVWCAGLFALPLLLGRHDPGLSQAPYARLRQLTDASYRLVMTPAAVIAIAAGTALVFARGVYEPWMAAKLAAVGLLVCLHAWQGLAVVKMGEYAGQRSTPNAALLIVLSIGVMSIVLLLVLAKPAPPPGLLPQWLLRPLYRSLPIEATPS